MKKLFLVSVIWVAPSFLMPDFLMAAENGLPVLQNQEKRVHFQEVDAGDDSDDDLNGKEIIPLFEADFSGYFQKVREETENRIYQEVKPYSKNSDKNKHVGEYQDLAFAFDTLFGEDHKTVCVEEQNKKNEQDDDVNSIVEFYSGDESEFNMENPLSIKNSDGDAEKGFGGLEDEWLKGVEREGEIEEQHIKEKRKEAQKEEINQNVVSDPSKKGWYEKLSDIYQQTNSCYVM